jgi:hypothetical protein
VIYWTQSTLRERTCTSAPVTLHALHVCIAWERDVHVRCRKLSFSGIRLPASHQAR